MPPIGKDLFKSACSRIWKQGSGSREGQREHLAQGKFKHEETWKNLYLYKAKGKFYTYWTDFKHPDGKRTSICKSEKEILKEFLNELQRVLKINMVQHLYDLACKWDILREFWKWFDFIITKEERDYINNSFWQEVVEIEYDDKKLIDILKANDEKIKELKKKPLYIFYEESNTEEEKEKMSKMAILEREKEIFILEQKQNFFTNIFNATPQVQITKKELEAEHEQKEILLQQKSHLEEEIKGADLKYAKLWYGADIAQAMKKELFEQIQDIEMKLETMKENENFEDFLKRIPEIINNLHELASNMLTNEENEWFREQIKELMQYTLHELTLNNKKELKIKLLDALENPENVDFSNGAPSNSFKFLQDNSFLEVLLIKIRLVIFQVSIL